MDLRLRLQEQGPEHRLRRSGPNGLQKTRQDRMDLCLWLQEQAHQPGVWWRCWIHGMQGRPVHSGAQGPSTNLVARVHLRADRSRLSESNLCSTREMSRVSV